MHEYKGIYYDDSSQSKRYYEGGAHFKYSDLCHILKLLSSKSTTFSSSRNSSFPNKPLSKNNPFPINKVEFTQASNFIAQKLNNKSKSKSKSKNKSDENKSLNTGNITTRAVTTIAIGQDGIKKQNRQISLNINNRAFLNQKINNNNILFYGKNNSVSKNEIKVNSRINKPVKSANRELLNSKSKSKSRHLSNNNSIKCEKNSRSTSRSISNNKNTYGNNSININNVSDISKDKIINLINKKQTKQQNVNYFKVKSRNSFQYKETISFKGNNASVDNNNNNTKYKNGKQIQLKSVNKESKKNQSENKSSLHSKQNRSHSKNESDTSNRTVNLNVLTIPVHNKGMPQSTMSKIKSNYTQLYLKKMTKQKQRLVMTMDFKIQPTTGTIAQRKKKYSFFES